MKAVEFRVLPVDGGWKFLQGEDELCSIYSVTGAALAGAKAMTATGVDVRVAIFDQARQPVGTKWFWAQERTSRELAAA